MKSLFRVLSLAVLLCTLALSVAFAADTAAPATTDSSQAQPSSPGKIVVYYFYFSPRCETCINMEKYSKEAVEKYFDADIKKGRVEWLSFDIEKPEHKHFWDDYKLDTKALVITEMKDGKVTRWKNCPKIWDLAGEKPAFLTYVRDEVQAYLSER